MTEDLIQDTEQTDRLVRSEKEPRKYKPRAERDISVRPSEKKTRRSRLDHIDELFVDPSEIPDGFSVEWKRASIYGKEDNEHLIGLEKDGWEPASPKDFPSRVGKNYKGTSVRHKDLILMIRPKELTQEALYEDRVNATRQVKTKLEEIGLSKPGEMQRVDSAGRPLAKVNISYDKIPVA